MSSAAPVAYVHIGAPKTGSTLIQRVLWRQRERLAGEGVLYPYRSRTEHFPAMLDLRDLRWGDIDPASVEGTWDRVAERVRTWDGNRAILSNELLGGATTEQIGRLVESLRPATVRVVYTARDLARQLVSGWQEQIKHKVDVPLEEFLDVMLDHGHDSQPPFAPFFWPLQQAERVLGRWSSVVGRDNVRVVTVPPPGAPPNTLWHRFCEATGLDSDRYDTKVGRANVALSVSQAELFRRLNAGLKDLSARDYRVLVNQYLMSEVAGENAEHLGLPRAYLRGVQQRAESLVGALREGGYPVVGDLDDLVPAEADLSDSPSPAAVTDAELLPLSIESTQLVLRLAAEQRAQIRRLERERATGEGRRPRRSLAALRRRARRLMPGPEAERTDAT